MFIIIIYIYFKKVFKSHMERKKIVGVNLHNRRYIYIEYSICI